MLSLCRFVVGSNRAIFMLRDGSYAWEIKDFLVAQDRCADVTVEGQVYPGKAAKPDAKGKDQKDAKKKTDKKAANKASKSKKQELWCDVAAASVLGHMKVSWDTSVSHENRSRDSGLQVATVIGWSAKLLNTFCVQYMFNVNALLFVLQSSLMHLLVKWAKPGTGQCFTRKNLLI